MIIHFSSDGVWNLTSSTVTWPSGIPNNTTGRDNGERKMSRNRQSSTGIYTEINGIKAGKNSIYR